MEAFHIAPNGKNPMAELNGEDLNGVDLRGMNLKRVTMSDTNLRGAKLKDAIIYVTSIEKETDKWDLKDLRGARINLSIEGEPLSPKDSWEKIKEIYSKRSPSAKITAGFTRFEPQ